MLSLQRLRLSFPFGRLIMRDIIQRHNRLNGLLFSVVEFGFIAVFVGAFAIYYISHRRTVMALIALGITLNCVPVVVYGLRQLAHARRSGTVSGSYLWDKSSRAQLRRENPHMLRDTLTLTMGTLLPFVSFAAVLFDTSRRPKQ